MPRSITVRRLDPTPPPRASAGLPPDSDDLARSNPIPLWPLRMRPAPPRSMELGRNLESRHVDITAVFHTELASRSFSKRLWKLFPRASVFAVRTDVRINHRIATLDAEDAALQALCMILAGNHHSEPGGGANAAVLDRLTAPNPIPMSRQEPARVRAGQRDGVLRPVRRAVATVAAVTELPPSP